MAYSGTNQLSQIAYNFYTHADAVELYGSNALVIGGAFSLSLSPGGSIAQTALVPAGTQLFLFKGRGIGPAASLVVSLGGQDLPYIALSNGPSYTLYGADVSAFAGQTATLAFAAPMPEFLIDDIQFSPLAIPEPSFLALACSGGLVLAVGLRRMA